MKLNNIHHIAIICSNYNVSKLFYTEVIGLKIEREFYRADRNSYKADCYLNGKYVVELFSFPEPPCRLSYPEATGLRHLAFEVNNINEAIKELDEKGIVHEPIRIDEYTKKQFFFLYDPDNLPIEIYEK